MSFAPSSDTPCGSRDSFDHSDSGNQAQYNMSLIIEPPAQDLLMNQFEVPIDCKLFCTEQDRVLSDGAIAGYDQTMDEFIIASLMNLAPNAYHWSEVHSPAIENPLSELENFLTERPFSRSSMSSSEALSDPTYVPSPNPSQEPRVPTPPFELQQQQPGPPTLYLFFNADTDVPARQEDLRNFARNPWADKVPDELLFALLERVQFPKAPRGKGSRKGAQGYFCHWPECTKTTMTIRLDHAKAHVAQHVDIRPFKCTECTRPFLRRADLKRHDKTCYARRVENGTIRSD